MPINDDWTVGDDVRLGTNLDDTFLYYSNTGHDTFVGGLDLDTIQLQDNPFTSVGLTLQIGGMSSIERIQNLDASAANITVLGQADFRDIFWSGTWTGNITGSFVQDLIYLGTYPGNGSNHVINVNAAEGDDVIFGTSLDYADVTIHGGAGNDVIQSLPRDTSTYDGDFKYYGDAGDDQIFGWEDNDYINGGTGEDDIVGFGGSDTLIGGADADDFFTNWYTVGWNTYTGGDGIISDTSTNRIIFQEWEDYSPSQHRIKIAGWSDIDQVINTASTELYLQFQGSFNLTGIALQNITGAEGGTGNDTIVGTGVLDTALGGFRGLILDGKAGDDTIAGSAYGDVMLGDAGDDILQGRGGNDVLTGGSGQDWFWFDLGAGIDTITDFTLGTDKLVLGPSLSAIDLYYYDGGASTLVEFDGGAAYAILSGVDPALLTAGDFLFA